MQGTIFDIKRCSLDDGPGIRTTVFLKGCPLQCLWCHNPESIRPERDIRYVAARCNACGSCAAACPLACHSVDGDGHTFDRGACTRCGRCTEACPAGALEVVGTSVSVADVMAVVLKDAAYYASSGGGLTLSGGEPLLQAAFARELLKSAGAAGVHTCLDTTGFGRTEDLLSLVECVDLFLYDIKETDPERHREFTGVDNRRILEHLAEIDRRGGATLLRCPIVPGLNDREGHLAHIARLAGQLRNVAGIDILPFHPFAADKFGQIGREYRLDNVAAASREAADAWVSELQSRTAVPVRRV